ncbi:DNA topoisomerase 2-alpha-like isoform X2 [Convolutriloba macropyga]|uniref:DNA topoisomerase 2-alpha-like isoform X2 n=1 Tax=Convolutriloba macropyga TaxID=536237 RepID=UPI003F521D74
MNGHAESGVGAGDTLSTTSSTPSGKHSVEKIYQKKTQLEHILLRPDTYIGSVEPITQPMWVYDGEELGMRFRPVTFTPGLYKIFDEILVNAADNKQRDPKMKKMKITIDPERNIYSVWNDGSGIPVQMHKTEKMYVPSLIFGHLLTSSNFDDTQKKVTGGRNGFGAKLCNVFSRKFTVETASKSNKKKFKQTWTNNMGKALEPVITENSNDLDYTCVTFEPDLDKFNMEKMDADTIALFTKRAYDMCATVSGISVYLNGKMLPVKSFKDYVDMFIKKTNDDDPLALPPTLVHEKVNPRWEVAVCNSESGFKQISFVNSIATTKGGTHVNAVVDQLVEKLIAQVNKKNKDKQTVKPFQVKNQMWVFINCLVENPTFDSQTKENMTLQAKKYGSKCELSDKFMKGALNCGIVDSVLQWLTFKAQKDLNKKGGTDKKQVKLKGIPKLDDANEAGGKTSQECTLILTEGDSAKSLAVSGLGVVGRDHYGVFPLRGKLLNVRDSTTQQIIGNAEINNIMKIVGLQTKKKYDEADDLKNLRYGKIMIMTDQDQDGSHIKGLLINMVHHFWPGLLRKNFVEQFITPIVKVSKGSEVISFFSLPEFDEWRSNTPSWKTYNVKYYKGLGTSTMKEAKEYFSDMERHRILFRYGGRECDDSIVLGFAKNKANERKDWLNGYMTDRNERRRNNEPEIYLYKKDTKTVTYSDFVHKELVLFSNADTERSIPNIMDGLKPGQRKVLFTCFKRNDKKEVKVAQLAGSVAEKSSYHHGEVSLQGTIVNLAQNFVGSNNLNLLLPIGQFGTRLQGGKDAASPRYIFTMLNPVTKIMFNLNDEPNLNPQFEDNQKIEPEFYCPVIPMVLINGAEGIGTGWSTKILNHDVREVIANIKRLLNAEEPLPMVPSWKNFTGTVRQIDEEHYTVFGNVAVLDETTLEITELPVGTWTQNYKEAVLEPMLNGTEKEKPVITDYKEYHTDTTVKFVVYMPADKLHEAENMAGGLHKFFKLSADKASSNMVLFDSNNCIKKYESTLEILKEFYIVRLDMYDKRKKYMVGMMTAESEKMSAIARFILEKIEGTIVVENKVKKILVRELIAKNYPSDPVKKWKDDQSKKLKMLMGDDADLSDEENEDSKEKSSADEGPDYQYLLGMPLLNLTKEKKDEILKQRDVKLTELKTLEKTTIKKLWTDDLDATLDELVKQEQLENEENVATIALSNKAASKKKGKMARMTQKQGAHVDTKPSLNAKLVDPPSADTLKAGKAKTGGAGRGKGKKGKTLDDENGEVKAEPLDSDEELAGKSLAERLNASGNSKALKLISPKRENGEGGSDSKAKKVAVKRPAASTAGGAGAKGAAAAKSAGGPKSKQMKLTDMGTKSVSKKSPKGSPAKKGKKKNPWETDSEDEESDDLELSDVDEDEDDDQEEVVTVKSKKPARIEDDDDDDDFNAGLDNDDDDILEVAAPPKVKPVTKKPASKPAPKAKTQPSTSKAKPAPKKSPAKKKLDSDEESEDAFDIDDDDDEASPVIASSRPGRSRKQVNYKGMVGSDEEEQEDDFSNDDDDDDVE